MILTLNIKRKYFEEIKTGIKKEEYREIKPYWEKRMKKEYQEIHIKLGYPKKDDLSRVIKFKWSGFYKKKIKHELFGEGEVEVFAIKLNERIEEDWMKRRENKTVGVLGTEYKIIFKTEEEDERLKKHGGYQDKSSKEIVIEIPKEGEEDLWGLKDLNYQIDKLIKHELIHAFLDESGLQGSSWAENEEMVDWIANQFDKMSIAFDEATKGENSTPVAFDDVAKSIKKLVIPAPAPVENE